MRFGFNTFNHSTLLGCAPCLPEQIAAAARWGWDAIGIDVPSVLAHEAAGTPPQALRALLDEHGIPCAELVPLSLSGNDDTSRRATDICTRLAPVLGATVVQAVVRDAPADAAANTRAAVERLADLGIGVAVEFIPTITIDSLAAVLELIERVDHPSLTTVIDSWHFFRGPSTWDDLDAFPLERIGFLQFDDAPPLVGDDLGMELMNRRVLPGEGELDLDRFCRALVAKGFDGLVSVEVLSEEWRARPAADLVQASLAPTRAYWARAATNAPG